MADQADVRAIALSLPETVEDDSRFAFSVRSNGKQKGFVWIWMERVEPRQPRVPRPDVIAVRVSGQAEKDGLLASDGDKFFTEPHDNSFPSVLVRLAAVEVDELKELIADASALSGPACAREGGTDTSALTAALPHRS